MILKNKGINKIRLSLIELISLEPLTSAYTSQPKQIQPQVPQGYTLAI